MDVFGDKDGAVHFDATAQGAEALAWIVDVPALEQRLAEAVRYQPQVEVVQAPVNAALTVVCEGRASSTRAEFGVDFEVTPTPNTPSPPGWNVNTRTARWPGSGFARWHPRLLAAGWPRGSVGGVVWSVDREQVAPLLALEPEAFAEQLETASQGALGRLELTSARSSWPLQQAQASRWCGPLPSPGKTPHSWVLAGDAAHNIHPGRPGPEPGAG